jgi:CoA:oxalate CoA-transferase
MTITTAPEAACNLLKGVIVLDMSQFLAGPYAALRLGDLGARIIKVERPDGGDLCRRLYLTDVNIDGDSTPFHSINRNKESFAADMKDPRDLAALRKLIARADVIVQNFRPGVIERLGLDYAAVRAINPRIVYASITGYGCEGPWMSRPGQDLLAQSRSGIMWLNGDEPQGPVPFGLAIADMLAGATVVQAVLAALVRRGITGVGAHVETSLLEVLIDMQFEVLTTYLNDGQRIPRRSEFRSAHAYLAAPYGVYRTQDSYLALAMMPLDKLNALLRIDALQPFVADPAHAFLHRDEIKRLIAGRLAEQTTDHWLGVLEPADIWCAKVLNWPELLDSEGFKVLDMLQTVTRGDNVTLRTTAAPFRVDGARPKTPAAAPHIGAHTAAIRAEFGL